jgi:hypothetical protein
MDILVVAPKRPPPGMGGEDKSARVKREPESEPWPPLGPVPELELELEEELEGSSGQGGVEGLSAGPSSTAALGGAAGDHATLAQVAAFVGSLKAGIKLVPEDHAALKRWSDAVGVKYKSAKFLPAVAEVLRLPPPS